MKVKHFIGHNNMDTDTAVLCVNPKKTNTSDLQGNKLYSVENLLDDNHKEYVTHVDEIDEKTFNQLWEKTVLAKYPSELCDCIRFCTECNKPIHEGYMTPDYDTYCSDECLGMTEDEIEEQYDDEDDCIFWTEWY